MRVTLSWPGRMTKAAVVLLLMTSPASGTAVSGPPWHTGPIIARFWFRGPPVDGVPVYGEQLRCWTGDHWAPLLGAVCTDVIFHGKRPPPIPARQRRME